MVARHLSAPPTSVTWLADMQDGDIPVFWASVDLMVGLARSAAEAGYRTYFTTAADLAARCHRAAIEGRWATTMRFFAGPTCLVIDLCRHRDYAETRVVCLGSAGFGRSRARHSYRFSRNARTLPGGW
jgi:hypothetical protein